MYKQDVELAKLLVSKLSDLNEQAGSLQDELQEANDNLAELQQKRADREKYSDILSRAASMLERTDLEVESPDLTQAESRVAELTGQLEDVNQEADKFRELVSELRERAPQLLEAVESGGELPEVDEVETTGMEETPQEDVAGEGEPIDLEQALTKEQDDTFESAEEPSLEEEGVEFEDDEAVQDTEDMSGQQGPVSIEEATESKTEPESVEAESSEDTPPVAAEPEKPSSPDDPSNRFLVEQLKTKEAFTWGRGATYIIDATSVLADVQQYNSEFHQQDENAMRDRLIRDLDNFSKEVTGTFYIVFNSWHQPVINFGNNIHLEYLSDEAEGKDWGVHRKVRELASTFSSEDRSVCVITNDSQLLADLSADRLFKIELDGFFRM